MVIKWNSRRVEEFSNPSDHLVNLIIGAVGPKVTVLKLIFFNFPVNKPKIFSWVKGFIALPTKPNIKDGGPIRIFN